MRVAYVCVWCVCDAYACDAYACGVHMCMHVCVYIYIFFPEIQPKWYMIAQAF